MKNLIFGLGPSDEVSSRKLMGFLSSLSSTWNQLFKFPYEGLDSEMAKLIWLIKLRWMAIGLFFCLAAPGYWIGYLDRSSFIVFIGALGFLFLFNFLTQLIFIEPRRTISPLFICFQLAFDVIILLFLLFLAGGFLNPFTGLFLLNVALGAVLIQGRYSWSFILLCHGSLMALQVHFVQQHQNSFPQQVTVLMIVSHFLLFSVWIVMRSLGSFLENYFENQTQAHVRLEKQDRLRALGAMAAGFSHEFASPLNTSRLSLDRLERRLRNFHAQIGNEELETLAEARHAILECEHVIHQMNASQLDVRDFNFKEVPVDEVVHDVVDSWKEEKPLAKVKLNLQKGIRCPMPVINLAQVILNLLDNAYEAAANQEITIQLQVVKSQIRLSITDQGAGFSKQVLDRLGEPFVTTKSSGTGLGLYVCQLFVQSLNGDLKIVNSNPQGTSVELAWPLSEKTEPERALKGPP